MCVCEIVRAKQCEEINAVGIMQKLELKTTWNRYFKKSSIIRSKKSHSNNKFLFSICEMYV